MNTQETPSRPIIRKYLNILIKTYGLKDPVPEKAMSILFYANLYGECIREIKEMMKVPCTLDVLTYEDHKFPTLGAAAQIQIPKNLPLYGTKSFEDLKIRLEIRKSLRKDYHKFVTCISHELAHIVLYSTKHSLHKSEIATDLFAMTCGFYKIMSQSRNGNWYAGYLDDEHFEYAYKYLQLVIENKKKNNFATKFRIFIERFKL